MLLAHVPAKIVEGFERRIAPAFAVTRFVGVVAGEERDPFAVSLRAVEGDTREFVGLGDLARESKERLAQFVLVDHGQSVGERERTRQ